MSASDGSKKKQEYGNYCVSCVLKGIHDCSCLKDSSASPASVPSETGKWKCHGSCREEADNQIASLTERVKELERINAYLSEDKQSYIEIIEEQSTELDGYDVKLEQLQSQLNAANKRNEELQEIHKQDLIKHERLERQLDKQGKVIEKMTNALKLVWESKDTMRSTMEALQSAAEIREGK